jgi:phage-related protein
VSTFNAGAIEASLTLDRSSWNTELKNLYQQIRRLEQTSIEIAVTMDADDFHAGAAQVELTSDQIGDMSPEIAVTMDSTDFHRAAAQVELTADLLSGQDINIHADANTAAAMTKLTALEAEVMAIDGNDINIGVNYDRNTFERLVGNGVSGAGGGGGYLGFWQILILGIIALSPILAVAIGAMSAAIVGFLAAIVASLGPLALIVGAFILLIKYFKDTDAAARTPEMRFLAGRLKDLQKIVKDFEKSKAAQLFFEAMGFAVDALNTVLEACIPLMDDLGRFISGVAQAIDNFVHSREFNQWLDFFGGFGLQMLNDFIHITGDLIYFLMNLFIAISPFAKHLMRGLVEDMDSLAKWSDHLGKNKGFQEWVQNARHYGPLLLDMIVEIAKAFMHIGDAIRPFVEPMIKGIIALAMGIQQIPTDDLSHLILLFVGIFTIVKVVIPLISTISTAFEILSAVIGLVLSPIGLVVLAIIGLAALFIYLYKTNAELRKQIAETWKQIQDTIAPIVEDITQLIQEHWGDIVEYAQEIWDDVKQIFLDAFTIIHQIVFFLLTAISFLWEHYGDIILDYVVGMIKGIAQIFQGLIQMLSGIMALIADILTGNWSDIGKDLEKIGRGFMNVLGGILRLGWTQIVAYVRIVGRTLTGIWHGVWDAVQHVTQGLINWMQGVWNGFVNWLERIPGHVGHALSGMWDGVVDGFRNAINAVIDFWNGLHFGIPGFDPPGPGPSFPGIDIHTPHINRMAEGAVVDEATLALVGEGGETEIVTPESKMAEIVKRFGGVDYKRLSAAIVEALGPLLGSVITHEMLDRILEKAGASIKVDSVNDDRSARALAAELAWEMRVAGFGAT